MKTVIAAMGALALASTVAQAAPARPAEAAQTAGQSYHVAAGVDHYRLNDSTRYHTPNQGAGTSRTSDANQG